MDSLNDMTLAQLDPEIQAVLDSELERQRGTLEMIASENFVPRAVLQAQGSVLTNKYAEGYPGRRYYGGCEFVDVAESLAIERAKQVFGGDYVNVQPHAGAQANAAALMAMANVGDPILGLSLAHGGHLTHGMRLNFSGKHYKAVAYEVDRETMRIEPEKVREAALAERPRVIIAGWSAYPVTSTSRPSAISQTRSAPPCGSIWRTSPASWPPACIRTPFPTPTSSRRRSTRPWAGLVPA